MYLLWGCNFFSIMSSPGYNLNFQKEVTQMVYFPRILTTDPGRLSQLLKSPYVSKDKFLHCCFTLGAHAKLFVYQGCTGFRDTSYLPPSVAMNWVFYTLNKIINWRPSSTSFSSNNPIPQWFPNGNYFEIVGRFLNFALGNTVQHSCFDENNVILKLIIKCQALK